MHKSKLIVLLLVAFAGGLLFFGYMNEIIIIKMPAHISLNNDKVQTITKKKVNFFFMQSNDWRHEEQELIWYDNLNTNVQQLMSMWLTWAHDEKFMQKKVLLESVIIADHTRETYLSFDRNPFSKEQSTFEKWSWIESLLKTIRETKLPIQSIYFLVHHQPLNDFHLDFSTSWPIEGFYSAM